MNMSDESLEVFLTDLFVRMNGMMLKIARTRIYNAYDAEDVVGNCWVSMVRNAKTLYKMEEPMLIPYISKTVMHAAIDFYRHKNSFPEVLREDTFFYQIGSNAVYEESETEGILMELTIDECVEHLQPRVAQAFKLLMEGISGKRVAEIMGVTEGTVRGYWLRAARAIKEECRVELQ